MDDFKTIDLQPMRRVAEFRVRLPVMPPPKLILVGVFKKRAVQPNQIFTLRVLAEDLFCFWSQFDFLKAGWVIQAIPCNDLV